MQAGANFSCGRGTHFFAPDCIRLGNNVYIGRYCSIECNADIGNDVLIANNVGIIGRHDHDISHLGVTIRFARSVRDSEIESTQINERVVIGDDVWIGFGAIVLSGVRIGSGSIIGAGAIVVKDVPPFSIICGVPGAIVGTRFKSERERLAHIEGCRKNHNAYLTFNT